MLEHFSASRPRYVPLVRRALSAVHYSNQTVRFSYSRIGSISAVMKWSANLHLLRLRSLIAIVGYVSSPNFNNIFERATECALCESDEARWS
jgi:hypothetical protein